MVLRTLLVKVGADISDFRKKFNDLGKEVESNKDKIQKTLNKVSMVVTGIGVAAIKMSMDFNKSMANIGTLLPGTLDAVNKRVVELKSTIQDMAMATGKSTGDIADGCYQVISAFGDTADTVKILDINVRAAAAGLATTTDAINLTSAVMKGYGDTSAEAAQKAADLAFQTVKLGQTTFPELAASIGRVVPLAKKLNVSQEELFATFATFTGVTGSAAEVATQFRGVLGALVTPTEEMRKAIKDLEYASAEAMVQELGVVGAMTKIIEKTDGTSESIGKLVSEKEALTLAMSMTGAQAEEFIKKLDAMKGSSGSLVDAYQKMTEGVNKAGFTFEQFKQKIAVTMQKLGDELAPAMMKVLDAAKPLLDLVMLLIKGFGTLPGPLKTVAIGFGGLLAASAPLFKMMTAFTGFKTVAGGSTLLGSSLKSLIGPLGIATAGFIALTLAAQRAKDGFNSMGKAIDDMESITGKKMSGFEKLWFKVENAVSKVTLGIDNAKVVQAEYNKKLAEAIEKYKDVPNVFKLGQEAVSKVNDVLQKGVTFLMNYGKGSEDAGKKGGKALVNLSKDAEDLGIKLRSTLVKELETTEAALEALSTSAERTPTAMATLQSRARELKKELGLLGTESKTVIKSLENIITPTMQLYLEFGKGQMSTLEFTERLRGLREEAEKLKDPLQHLELAEPDMEPFIEEFDDTFEQITKGLGIWTPKMQEEWEKNQKNAEEAAEKTKEAWKNAFQTIGSLLQILADEFDNSFGKFVSYAGLALDQIGQQFKGLKEKGASTFEALAKSVGNVLIGKLGGSIGEMISGAKSSFASLGASIGSAIAMIPGIGTAAGAAISLLGGLFGGLFKKKEKLTEAQKAEKALQAQIESVTKAMKVYGDITEQTAKIISEDIEKGMKGYIAVSKHFSDIIKDVGVNQENVNKLWSRAADIIDHFTWGELSAADATKALSDSFKELVAGTKELGKEGSAAMKDFLTRVRESKLEIKEIQEYTIGWMETGISGLSKMVAAVPDLGSKFTDLKTKLVDLKKEQEGVEEGSEAWVSIQDQIKATESEIESLSGRFPAMQKNLDSLALDTVAMFNVMMENGASYGEALAKIKDPLLALQEQYSALGLTGDEAFMRLAKVAELSEKNKVLIDTIQGADEVLKAFGNTGYLTQDIFTNLQQRAVNYFNQLIKAGYTEEEALRTMQPLLKDLNYYAEEHNLKVTQGAQNLLDMAGNYGVVVEKQESAQEQQERLFKGLGDRMEQIMKDAGETISESIKSAFGDAFESAETEANKTKDNIAKAFEKMAPTIDIKYKYENLKIPKGSEGNIPGFQKGGTFSVKRRTPIFVDPGELISIIPFGKISKDRISRIFSNMIQGIQETLGAIENISGYKGGGHFTRPELARVGERPETLIPDSELARMLQGGTVQLNAVFNINTLNTKSMRELVRTEIGPQVIQWVKVGLGKSKLREALL